MELSSSQPIRRIAVFFGGRSPEHDVSIVTGLQALQAIDQTRFRSFPVYVSPEGKLFVGEALRRASRLLPDTSARGVESVTVDLTPSVEGRGRLLPLRSGFFQKPKPIEFDVALLAFHGLFGEDGRMQSLFELANVPYTGMRTLASAVLMDKSATKRMLRETAISLLPDVVLNRQASGILPDASELGRSLSGIDFPVIVKPVHLGSSIGVARAVNIEEVRAALAVIFRFDTQALVEPFVENLVEYNLAVRRTSTGITTSAIERPKSAGELLDFKDKYMAGGNDEGSGPKMGGKTGGKLGGTISPGMLAMTRELNPQLSSAMDQILRNWATQAYAAVNGTGAPRIDFLCNGVTGELWLNEVNPCPGSLGYFLWEAAPEPLLFSELLTHLIDEALAQHRQMQLPADPTHPDARLFKRP